MHATWLPAAPSSTDAPCSPAEHSLQLVLRNILHRPDRESAVGLERMPSISASSVGHAYCGTSSKPTSSVTPILAPSVISASTAGGKPLPRHSSGSCGIGLACRSVDEFNPFYLAIQPRAHRLRSRRLRPRLSRSHSSLQERNELPWTSASVVLRLWPALQDQHLGPKLLRRVPSERTWRAL
jgi:hypothetical protein